MGDLNKTGVFYVQFRSNTAAGVFPEDLRSRLANRLEPRFLVLFGALMLVFGVTVLILSFRKPPEITEKDIIKLQERYASLVLQKELPKEEVEEKVEAAAAANASAARAEAEAKAAAEAAAAEAKANETVVQRQERKAASSEQRAAKREAMKQQLDKSGLFAELTAASGSGSFGGGGGSRMVKDLIGGIDAGQSLSGMALSGESFVQRREASFGGGPGGDGTGIGGGSRRGERTEGGTIGTSGLAAASAGTLKSAGSVEVSDVENVVGEAANDASRDMKTLSQVLMRYQPRLKKVFEDFLKRNPDLSGQMVVKFTIEADGSVSNLIVVRSEMKDEEFEKMILRHIQRIKFPAASGKVQIEWPLSFSAS